MPTIEGILTFMIRINFSLSQAEHEKCFITLGPGRDISMSGWYFVSSYAFYDLVFYCMQINIRLFHNLKRAVAGQRARLLLTFVKHKAKPQE